MFVTYNLTIYFFICCTCCLIFLFGFIKLIFVTNYIFILLINELLIFILIIVSIVAGFLYNDIYPQIFSLFILVTSSCDVVTGLACIVSYNMHTNSILTHIQLS